PSVPQRRRTWRRCWVAAADSGTMRIATERFVWVSSAREGTLSSRPGKFSITRYLTSGCSDASIAECRGTVCCARAPIVTSDAAVACGAPADPCKIADLPYIDLSLSVVKTTTNSDAL